MCLPQESENENGTSACERPFSISSCSLGAAGSQPAPTNNEYSGICQQLVEEAFNFLDDSSRCHQIRLKGMAWCGCPGINETCPGCPGGAPFPPEFPNPILSIPFDTQGAGPSLCGDWQTTPRLSLSLPCGEQNEQLARYCGCPSTPRCTLCGPKFGETTTSINLPNRNIPLEEMDRPLTCTGANELLQEELLRHAGITTCNETIVEQYFWRRFSGADVVGLCCREEEL